MRLLIVDDHEVVRRGIVSILSQTYLICGEAADGQDALGKAATLRPDLVIMDISMPNLNGLEATRQMRKAFPECKVVILSQHDAPEMARLALQAGAAGYVIKTSIATDLISAIEQVAKGKLYFDVSILDPKPSSQIDVQEILQRSAAFERALRDSEELYRTTFERTAVGIAHVSPEGQFLRVNQKMCEITGYSESELRKLSFQEITYRDDIDLDVAQAEKVTKGDLRTYSMEKRYVRKDGSLIWINLTVSAVRDEAGNLKHFISVVEDIDSRKRAEEALLESQARLALALESSGTAMFEWDMTTRRGKWNSQMAALYDFHPREESITAEEWRSLFHPDDVERLAKEGEAAWDGSRDRFTFEFRALRRNGGIRWMLSHGRIVRDADGRALRMVGTHTDISEQKEQGEKRRQSDERFKAFFHSAVVGAVRADAQSGRYLEVNDTFCQITGYTREELESLTISDLTHPDDRDFTEQRLKTNREKGTPTYRVEKRYVRKDGSTVWVEIAANLVADHEGKPLYYVGIISDIGQRRKMDEALRQAEQRMRFSLEAADIGTWEWDIPNGKVSWSSNMEAVHGQASGSFRGTLDSFLEGVFIEDREKLSEQIQLAISGHRKYDVEYRQYRSDGSLGWMRAIGQVVFDGQGKPERMFGICANVTERKKAEDTNGLLASIVASSDDAIVSKKLDGTITSWNRGAENLFGYTAAEAIGQHITLIVPDDRRAEEADILARLARAEKIDHFETVRRRKDGSLVEVSITISPVKDSAGRVIGASKVARDVTAKKRWEAAAAAGVRQQRALFHLADDLHRAGSLNAIYDAALDAILDSLQCDRASILLADETGVMHFRSWRGLSDRYRAAVDGHSAWKPDDPNPQPVCIDDIRTADLSDSLKATVSGEGIGSLAFIPLVSNDKLIGKFMTYFNSPHNFAQDEIELSLTIARQLAFAIERRRSEEALRRNEEKFRRLSETLDTEVRKRTQELRQKNADLMRQSEQVRELSRHLLRVQEEERRHVARELHDSAGQTLAALGMRLDQIVYQAHGLPPEYAGRLQDIQKLVKQLHSEIRTASYLLHPPLLDEAGLASALKWYIQGLSERSGIVITLDMPPDFDRLPSDLELALFRLIQECLTNIHRHSGSKQALVLLERDESEVRVDVSDDGKGIAAERLAEIRSGGSGVGIRGMQERLRQFGGELTIESNHSGTRISAKLPRPKAATEIRIEPLEAAV